MRIRNLLVLAVGMSAIVAIPTRTEAGPIFYDPAPYLGFEDSPFGGSGYSVYLETFEDGMLNVPGVSASGGSAIDGPYVDSVENNGHSWYSNFALDQFTFSFNEATLGTLPTVAGIVLTDVGYNSLTPYFANFVFEAFGPDGASLGSTGPYYFGDGHDTGEKNEDRFFGVSNSAGISAIRISTNETRDWEVDHLQYGVRVPEPGSLILAAIGMAALVRRRYRCESRSVISTCCAVRPKAETA